METAEKTQRQLYWQDKSAENNLIDRAERTAAALNKVMAVYKHTSPTEFPTNPAVWGEKRAIECDPKLQELLQYHKRESINITIPGWIQKIVQAVSEWQSNIAVHSQVLQYCFLDGDVWKVNRQLIEQTFESSQTYRRYLNGEQIARLARCKRYIAILDEEPGITFPFFYSAVGRVLSHPFLSRDGDKFKPNLRYVLTGEILHISTPMQTWQKEPGILI